ncbi:hypothetical protein ONZ45_g6025 [Pleurotus djamor]|nr:hypothetical protein ONZ45_g10234 [Pleurotus djamor]KAJ8516677.1 hypothetical protein ONZ45_g6025 [Pleurotus djamor]
MSLKVHEISIPRYESLNSLFPHSTPLAPCLPKDQAGEALEHPRAFSLLIPFVFIKLLTVRKDHRKCSHDNSTSIQYSVRARADSCGSYASEFDVYLSRRPVEDFKNRSHDDRLFNSIRPEKLHEAATADSNGTGRPIDKLAKALQSSTASNLVFDLAASMTVFVPSLVGFDATSDAIKRNEVLPDVGEGTAKDEINLNYVIGQ